MRFKGHRRKLLENGPQEVPLRPMRSLRETTATVKQSYP